MGRKAKVQVVLAALISAPLSAQTYDPTLITPQLLGSPQGMTALNLGDDATRSINLGFTFDYFGKSYTSAWVSSNGFVSFQGPANLCCSGMPMQNAQRNTIYAYWTDLISNPNPYFKPIDDGILFGWYGTYEYYNSNRNTFEIALYANGNIQINYGAVANSYHTVAAGLTGPTSSDNLQLFYGTNVTSLNNQSGLLSVNAPKVAEVQSPVVVAPTPAPTVAPNPVATTSTPVAQTQTQTAVAEIQAAAVQEVVVASVSPQLAVESTPVAQVEVATTATQAESVSTEQTAQAVVQSTTTTTQQEAKEEQKDAQLPPGGIPGVPTSFGASVSQSAKPVSTEQTQQVSAEIKKERQKEAANTELASLNDPLKRDTVISVNPQDVDTLAKADATYNSQYGEQKTSETVDVTYSLDPQSGTTFGQVSSVNGQANPTPVISFTQSSTDMQTGQAQQLLLLNMQNEMSSGERIDIGDVNTEDAEVMAQLAVIPVGFTAYTQLRLQEIQFYKPRDIYQNSRIPDQNMALYRLMNSQDIRWQQMVGGQYERR